MCCGLARTLYVGASSRATRGVAQLAAGLGRFGYAVREVAALARLDAPT